MTDKQETWVWTWAIAAIAGIIVALLVFGAQDCARKHDLEDQTLLHEFELRRRYVERCVPPEVVHPQPEAPPP